WCARGRSLPTWWAYGESRLPHRGPGDHGHGSAVGHDRHRCDVRPGCWPLAIGAAALGLGGLAQAAIAVPALRAARALLRGHVRLIAVGAGAVAIYPLAFYSSMHLAGVAVGAVVSLASAPLASGILQHFLESRPLSRTWALAAALGIAGSTVLCLAATSAPGAIEI